MGRWVKKVAGLVFSLVLGGCPCGNGYPYGADGGSCSGNGASSRDQSTPTPIGGSGSTSSALWVDPAYRCTPTFGSPKASDRGLLQPYSNGWILYGDLCDREQTPTYVRLGLDQVRQSNLGLGLLGYQDGIYAPALAGGYISAWCVDALAAGTVEAAVFTPSGSAASPILLVRLDSATEASGSAVRTLGTLEVRYEMTGYRLTMASAFSASDPFQHDGLLTIGTTETALLCRVTHP